MKVEIWQSEDEIGQASTVVVLANDPNKMGWIEHDAVLIDTIEGVDWDDCMRQYHELMDFEPFEEDKKNNNENMRNIQSWEQFNEAKKYSKKQMEKLPWLKNKGNKNEKDECNCKCNDKEEKKEKKLPPWLKNKKK